MYILFSFPAKSPQGYRGYPQFVYYFLISPCLLTSAITIVSIVIALFSVLLTSVATKNSDVKNYFFSVVNKNLFNNQVKRCILYGFMNLGISLVLIMSDIVDKKIVVLLQYLWVFTSIYFVIAGYKFISLLYRYTDR